MCHIETSTEQAWQSLAVMANVSWFWPCPWSRRVILTLTLTLTLPPEFSTAHSCSTLT